MFSSVVTGVPAGFCLPGAVSAVRVLADALLDGARI
jgi:hypothetical protein